jgi:transcriptional regulator with XRE-family HTH domain
MQLNLGMKIRELRKRDERTQEMLAEALGVTSQAVSRWESGGSYPDMEIIPSIANYFGVSIDELFGYDNERAQKIDKLATRINEMNAENNGEDVNIDECISLAHAAMVEFPGNERIMQCLASVLFNAGYVRYGEFHLINDEGYGVYDVDRHRNYTEWSEAIALYEKLLNTLKAGEERNKVVKDLTQLYLNVGERDKAMAIADSAPSIYQSKEFLRINACDGKEHAKAYSETLLSTVRACSELMIGAVMSYEQNLTITEKVESVLGAIKIFDIVCTDGNYGTHNAYIARMYTLLSLYLWLGECRDEAFAALDKALYHYKMFNEATGEFTAPLLRLAREKVPDCRSSCASLADDWPWWSVQEYPVVKPEIQADPRWKEWVDKTRA